MTGRGDGMQAASLKLAVRLLFAVVAAFLAATALTLLGPFLSRRFQPDMFDVSTFVPAWIVAALGLPSVLLYGLASWRRCRFSVCVAAFLWPSLLTLSAYLLIALTIHLANENEALLGTLVYLLAALCHGVSQTAAGMVLALTATRDETPFARPATRAAGPAPASR